ncbi:hypothetical protein HED60_16535 [Planctomycetales bacterium ZRK34]|nr:hypothetical protein HED60_16535 [Planctomycetales bacterium ZRK34]
MRITACLAAVLILVVGLAAAAEEVNKPGAEATITKHYDLSSLVVQPPYFDNAPSVDIDVVLPKGQVDLYSDGEPSVGMSFNEIVQSIMHLIRDTIEPDEWRTRASCAISLNLR